MPWASGYDSEAWGILFVSLFLASWIVQLFFEWHVYVSEQREHGGDRVSGRRASGTSSGSRRSRTGNPSSCSSRRSRSRRPTSCTPGRVNLPDSEERIEAKLDALLEQSGVDPKDIEKTLAPKHQKRT